MREGKCIVETASQETGSAEIFWELFSEGERIMTVLAFLFFLLAVPPENLRGTILDPSGAGVGGAKVEITAAGASHLTYSDSDGAFYVENIDSGNY